MRESMTRKSYGTSREEEVEAGNEIIEAAWMISV
jgi:hypothetical protein